MSWGQPSPALPLVAKGLPAHLCCLCQTPGDRVSLVQYLLCPRDRGSVWSLLYPQCLAWLLAWKILVA